MTFGYVHLYTRNFRSYSSSVFSVISVVKKIYHRDHRDHREHRGGIIERRSEQGLTFHSIKIISEEL